MLILGFASTNVAPDATDLCVTFSWMGTKACTNRSPKIKVINFPPNTKIFKVVLNDLDAPSWNHGGGSVENDGMGIIHGGSLRSRYNGPCPPSGVHRYEFTVRALDADGVIIGVGKAVRKFSM